MIARILAATALVLAVQAAPAAAAAIDPLKPCYVSAGAQEQRRETISVRGTGFSADATVDITVDGVVQLSGLANGVGEFRADVKAPHQERGERPFTVTVTERGNPANIVSATSRVTALHVRLRPKRAATTRRVRFIGRGFTADGPVFGHYVFGERLRRTVRLVRRSTAPCGRFSVRRRQIPIRRPRTGEWTLQVDQQRDYSPDHRPWVRVPITVRQFFRPVD
jgi:hypothetical protein